jgi:tRNA-specific adenosine deaminase 1
LDKNEWTVLAAWIIENDSSFTIASIATGTKSIPRSQMNKDGFILNDCHAEILARWSLFKYLYSELKNDSTIFVFNEETWKYTLKEGIGFHLYISEPPCGDASFLYGEDS